MLLEHPDPTKLLPYLEQFPLRTLPHRYMLRHWHDESIADNPDQKVLVDDLTAPSYVVMSMRWRNIVFARNVWGFRRFMQDIPKRPKGFACLPQPFVAELHKRYQVEWEKACRIFIVPDDWVAPQVVDLPTEPIHIADAGKVARLWPHSHEIGYIQNRIANAPSVAVYLKGKLAAFTLIHGDGTMGILHVMEKYRNEGLAQLVSVRLIEIMRKRGDIPWCAIVVENRPSLGLSRKMGFREIYRASWIGIK
jgi:ribosomal protein S18 acetylase RimI-like enzyme